ncbi:MAG TPA: hypothetical protein VFA96_01595 [Nocardioides sp.]|nr:hypothetical protein [Nocardioides sp.]
MLIVDAANVIGARPDGWWRDRPGATARLVGRLRGAELADVVVVVEGAARSGVSPGGDDTLRVVHAPGSGDDTIVSLVAEAAGREGASDVTVVTADRALRTRVRELGADVIGPNWLYQRLPEDGSAPR